MSNRFRFILVLSIFGVILIGAICLLVRRSIDVCIDRSCLPTISAQVGDVPLRLFVAETREARQNGLSGLPTLAEGEGMFFRFSHPDRYAFWMKDMRFAIDMLWIDDANRIVDITENFLPESFPNTVEPSVPIVSVVEVPSGWVRAHTIEKGDVISFEK